MDNEYTTTLSLKVRDPNNYHKDMVREITFHVAFTDYEMVRPFSQANTADYLEDEVDYVCLTYCLIRWKNQDGKIQHVTGATWKNPKDTSNQLQARQHAFADALKRLFAGYIIINPMRNNTRAIPSAVDVRPLHTYDRAVFWEWFRKQVEPDVVNEINTIFYG